MNEASKKAVLYLRVSTDEQVDNFSLDTQEEICRREADRRGYEVVQVFREEGKSAKSIMGRPVLIQMLDHCKKHKKSIQAVIIYRIDRLSRQTIDFLSIKQKLSDIGIKLISTAEPTGDKPAERYIEMILAGAAQLDNEMRSERSKNGMYARFKSGLFHNGHPPTGYIMIDGLTVKDPNNFDKMKKAWDLMATGSKTLREIAEIMNSWGVRTTTSSGIESPLRIQSAQRIFRSRFYMGILYSPTYNEEVQGQHIPMVSREQFEKVQQILDGRCTFKSNLVRRNTLNADFPLRRMTKCGKCGLSCSGSWSTGRRAKFAYYFCRQRSKCVKRNIRRKDAHDALNALLKSTIPTSACYKLFFYLLENEQHKRAIQLQGKRNRRETQLRKLKEIRNFLVQKHLLGVYSDEVFKEQSAVIEKNIQSIELTTSNELLKQYSLNLAKIFIQNFNS